MKALLAAILALLCASAHAQSVEELARHYSGQLDGQSEPGTLRFVSSGRVDFGRPDYKGLIWEVPAGIRRIVIAAGVRAEATFTTRHSLTIEGEGADKSELFGTPTPGLLHDAKLDGGGGCIPYSAVYAEGRGVVVSIRQLSSRNPVGYHFTGKDGAVLHLDSIRAIDDRGGVHNHSDGISAGPGSTVKNSYFETADDVIKVYADITVENTTIRMIRNAVPIQFGWGSYGSGARGVFRNIKIIGDSGRNRDFPIFNAHAGLYRKTVVIDGLEIDAPRATLFRFNDPSAEINIVLHNARGRVGQYGEQSQAAGTRMICGSTDAATQFDCRSPEKDSR